MFNGYSIENIYREIYNVFYHNLNQDQLMETRFESFDSDVNNVYGLVIFIRNHKNLKIRKLTENDSRLPLPVFSKGIDKQVHIVKLKYAKTFDFKFLSKCFSFPTLLDIAEIENVERKQGVSQGVCVNVNLGANYFCVYSIVNNNPPVQLQDYFELILYIVSRKSDNDTFFLTTKEIKQLERLYMDCGIFLKIYEYKVRLDYDPLII